MLYPFLFTDGLSLPPKASGVLQVFCALPNFGADP